MTDQLTITICLTIVFVAMLGWLTHWSVGKFGPNGPDLLRSFLAFCYTSILTVCVFSLNYFLLSQMFQRNVSRETLSRDPFLRIAFAHSPVTGGSLMALAIVALSFGMVGWGLTAVGKVVKAIREKAWQADPLVFGVLVVLSSVACVMAYIVVRIDVGLFQFRLAQQIFSSDLGLENVAKLPDPDHLVEQYKNTMGGFVISSLSLAYALIIVFMEKHMASTWARLTEASRAYHSERQNPNPNAVAGIVQPTPPATPAPPIFRITPTVGPATNGNGHTSPGAAPFIRSVPFNPVPRPRTDEENG